VLVNHLLSGDFEVLKRFDRSLRKFRELKENIDYRSQSHILPSAN